MKKLLIFLAILLCIINVSLIFCSSSGNSNKPTKISGPYYSFESFKGKTINYMYYCDGCGSAGDELTIYFTDKTKLVVWAYKYDMEFYN
jgi:uncharacterized protein YxeA